MNIISNKEEFIEWCKPLPNSLEKNFFLKTNYRVGNGILELNELRLENLKLNKRHFESTEFNNCNFIGCDFTSTFFASCTFRKCSFEKCEFTWSKFFESDLIDSSFQDCVIAGLEICDVILDNSTFVDCSEILDLIIRGNWKRQISFKNCYLGFLDIEPISKENTEIINFTDCLINESSFDRVDFSNSKFKNCSLSLNQFSACTFSNETMIGNNDTPGNEYNLIDIRTISNSDIQSPEILEKLFGIHSPEIKEYIHSFTSRIEFQSIFISYSFEDKQFATRINNELLKKGIITFLWEKDSPGGKKLKDIMSSNIKTKDRILFIASKSSLRSPACQYELTEGRKKQESIWEDVLFPIHIDNYLFEVKKDNIRPLKAQNDYWNNIIELKNLNSLDFSVFAKNIDFDKIEYDRLIYRLIRGLRKEK